MPSPRLQPAVYGKKPVQILVHIRHGMPLVVIVSPRVTVHHVSTRACPKDETRTTKVPFAVDVDHPPGPVVNKVFETFSLDIKGSVCALAWVLRYISVDGQDGPHAIHIGSVITSLTPPLHTHFFSISPSHPALIAIPLPPPSTQYALLPPHPLARPGGLHPPELRPRLSPERHRRRERLPGLGPFEGSLRCDQFR
jgi:hypothetical protein